MPMNYSHDVLKTHHTFLLGVSACAVAASPFTAAAWQPGVFSTSPDRMSSSGFAVDTGNRNDVLAFWHAVYQASEGYEKRIGWSGNYKGNEGRVSNDFIDDVERRVNYFRAMCGVPATVRFNTGATVLIESADVHKPPRLTLKSAAAQAAALMLIRNYNPSTGKDPAIDHDPPASLVGWSEAAWNANARGNLAFGIFGPGAVTEYMVEELSSGSTVSSWNSLVGHRRWITFPDSTDFATGDQPGESVARPPTNVLYISQKPDQLVPDPTPGFVAYPPPGFFPARINSRYWSLSHGGADFDSASVKVTDAGGNPVAVSGVMSNANFGSPALIWQVSGAAAAKSVYSDATFNVKVTGIGGTGVPASFSYVVTLINPDRILSDQTIIGSGTAASGGSTTCAFTPPVGAESIGITAFLKKSSVWKETAEKKSDSRVIDRTAANYSLKAKMASFPDFGVVSGSRAFRLTFPVSYDLMVRGVPEQSFELDRPVLPDKNAQVRFLFRRGFMTKGSTLVVETSNDGGVIWKSAGKSIKGVSNTIYDVNVSSAVINLPKSDQPIRIRFRYFAKPGVAIYTHEASPKSPTGIFIDDITTKNCSWLDPRKTTLLPASATKFVFNSSTAGGALNAGDQWRLGMTTKLGGKWFPHGPLKAVTIKAP